MFDVATKLLNDIKSMYVNSLPCVKGKGGRIVSVSGLIMV